MLDQTKTANKAGQQQDEDASKLPFPKEFENAETLLISEVHMLLKHETPMENTQDHPQNLSILDRKK